MSIDIKNLAQTTAKTAGDARPTAETRGARGAEPDRRSPAATGDTVTLTETARRLTDLEQSIAAQPAVDAARVAELRQAIEDGSYRPNPERIADKLLRAEGML